VKPKFAVARANAVLDQPPFEGIRELALSIKVECNGRAPRGPPAQQCSIAPDGCFAREPRATVDSGGDSIHRLKAADLGGFAPV